MTTRRQWLAPALTTILAASLLPVKAQAYSQPCVPDVWNGHANYLKRCWGFGGKAGKELP